MADDEFPGPALAAISPDRDQTEKSLRRALGDGTGRERKFNREKFNREKFNDDNYDIDAGVDGTNADNQENDDDYDAKRKNKMMMLQTMTLMMTVIDDSGLCGQTV